jgi:sugar O-acyltransferase (sialic acid O-acetyltransferase NeuD family)
MALVILGAGGHGRVVAETAQASGVPVLGFVDEDPARLEERPLGLPVFGRTALLESGSLAADAIALGVGRNAVRLALLRRFQGSRWAMPIIIHPRSWCSPTAVIGAGSLLMANATVQTACRIGAAVIVNTNASVDHDCVLGDGVHISPGAHLAGDVMVGEGTHIGLGASVIEGIRIGANCLIAAGAVVVRDVPDGQRVAGVPARPMPRQEHG